MFQGLNLLGVSEAVDQNQDQDHPNDQCEKPRIEEAKHKPSDEAKVRLGFAAVKRALQPIPMMSVTDYGDSHHRFPIM